MGHSRGRMTTFAVLAVVAVAIGGVMGRVPAAELPATSSPETSAPAQREAETVRVHVSGMVVSPGVVHVATDAIVADAIDAAGGLLPDAVVDQINLAAPVVAGDQIVVPGPGDKSGESASSSGDGVISINRATAGELEALPGVGPVLAERIVAFREENGGFEVVEELLEVPGIGEAKLAAMRDLVAP
ncbi:MAG: ComEA family DNA-binding protein [Actinomycetota bacterium]